MQEDKPIPIEQDRPLTAVTRLVATSIVSGCSTIAFLFYAIFLRSMGHAIPLTILIGAAVGLVAIWLPRRQKPESLLTKRKIQALEAKIAALEERITDAETVTAFEDRLAEKEAARITSPPVSADSVNYPHSRSSSPQTN